MLIETLCGDDNCITFLLVLRVLFRVITFYHDVFFCSHPTWSAPAHLCDLIQYKNASDFFFVHSVVVDLLIGINDPTNESISF